MIKGIGHIGIAVKNIDRVLNQLCHALEIERPPVKIVPERCMKIAVISFGSVSIELLEETAPEGMLSGPVEERGDFIHHLSLITDAIDEDITDLKTKGVKMAQEKPQVGLRGKRISFITSGMLGDIPVELTEP